MKYADVQRLHEAGLISEEQRQKILAHFQLKEEGGKLLSILSAVGALLITGGIALLIASHWDEIPRGLTWLMDEELPIDGHLAGLFVLMCWWGPLAASMLGRAWLAGASAESCQRAVTKLFRRPVLSALGLAAFPLVSTLLFRPVFTDLAVGGSDAVVPQRLLTIFAWCHYGALIAPVCLALGVFVYLGRDEDGRSSSHDQPFVFAPPNRIQP
jgi:hypothetical protein